MNTNQLIHGAWQRSRQRISQRQNVPIEEIPVAVPEEFREILLMVDDMLTERLKVRTHRPGERH